MQFVNENFAFRTLLTDFVLSRLEHAVAGGLLNPPPDCAAPDSASCHVR
jgi:hypothetical protein